MVTNNSQGSATPHQDPLFVEDWTDAIRSVAYAIGGMKALALMLWPGKGRQAENWLSDCLNPDRAAKLAPEEFLQIIRIGREHGVHTLMCFITDDTGYTRPSPVSKEDRQNEAIIQFNRGLEDLKKMASKLQRLGIPVEGDD